MEKNYQSESGNALIYVLIAIALFAALNFTLGREGDTSEANTLPAERVELYATQLMSYAGQVKSVVDQMMFTGSDVSDLDFTLPNGTNFNAAPLIHKVYHPQGGGLNAATLNSEVVAQDNTNPVAGWYLGSFNNVEWTRSTNNDVILVAYQISEQVCASINEKITGSSTIPTFDDDMNIYLIDDSLHTGTNATFDVGNACASCDGYLSLCARDSSTDFYAFYNVIIDD